MKIALLVCALVAGFMLPLQSYTVINNLASKKVTLNNFVYYIGSGSFQQPGNQVLDPGETWSENISEPGMTASFTAKVPTKNGPLIFQVTGLIYSDVVVFSNNNGTIGFDINP